MANAKTVKVDLLKSVQVATGKEPLKPGTHTLPEDVVKRLDSLGLIKKTETTATQADGEDQPKTEKK